MIDSSGGSDFSTMSDNSSEGTARERRWPLITAIVAATIIVILIGARIAAPGIAERLIVDTLLENGAASASVEDVELSVLDGNATVVGLSAEDQDGNALRVARAEVSAATGSLLSSNLRVRHIRISGAEIPVERRADGTWGLKVIDLDRLLGPEASPAAIEDPNQTETTFALEQVQITDTKIVVHSDGAENPETLEITALSLNGLDSANSDRPNDLRLVAKASKGDIQINGTVTPLADTIRAILKADISDVESAPLLSLLGLADIGGTISVDGNASVSLPESGPTGSFDGTLSISKAAFASKGDRIAASKLDWTGALAHTGSEITVNGAATLARLSVKSTAGDEISAASLRSTVTNATIPAGTDANRKRALFKSSLALKDLSVAAADGSKATLKSLESKDIDGAVPLASDADGPIALKFQSIRVDDLNAATSDPDASAVAASLVAERLALSLSGLGSDLPGVTADGMIELTDASGKSPDAEFKSARLTWTGTMAYGAGADTNHVRADGRLESLDLSATVAEIGLSYGHSSFSWNGSFSLDRKSGEPIIKADIAATGSVIQSRDPALDVLRLEALNLKSVNLRPGPRLEADSISIQNARGMINSETPDNPGFAFSSLEFTGLTAPSDSRVIVDRLAATDVTTAIVREKSGRVRLIDELLSLAKRFTDGGDENNASPPKKHAGDPEKRPFSIAVKTLAVGGKSEIRVEDRAVAPPVRLVASPVTTEVKNLDTLSPEIDSKYKLSAKIGEFGKLESDGSFRPFNEQLTLLAKARISSLELPSISAYVRDAIGQDIIRGRLNAMLDIDVVDGQLAAESEIRVSRLKVRAAPDENGTGSGVPIETAIKLLRNDKDEIQVKIPVKGSIESPDFDLSDAINQAIGGALREAALTTVKLIFPLGAVVSAIGSSGKKRVVFDPVTYPAGDTKYAASESKQLTDLAALLNKRPEISLTLCGRATAADRQALLARKIQAAQKAQAEKAAAPKAQKPTDQKPANAKAAPPPPPPTVSDSELLEFANGRAAALKRELTEQKRISADRLFLCKPEIAKDGAPRVDVLL